jgi:hypothetical protein
MLSTHGSTVVEVVPSIGKQAAFKNVVCVDRWGTTYYAFVIVSGEHAFTEGVARQ